MESNNEIRVDERIDRNLDGVYFRVKRNDKWGNACFSDMTEEERNRVMEDRPVEWLKSLCNILADTIRSIGDQFDIVCGIDTSDDSEDEYEDEDE